MNRPVLLMVGLLGLFVSGCSGLAPGAGPASESNRRVMSLDGTWEIGEGTMDTIPGDFERRVPVPGLVTLAQPPFVEAGPVVDRFALSQKDPRRDAFWYRKTFQLDGPVPTVAMLKVSKAMFGTRVFLNDRLLGDHAPSFTPGYFDARGALRPGENTVLIRVGADRDAVTKAVASGYDVEKERYIPGIFDSVSLVLSGTPHFLHIQAAPDITNRAVRVQAVLRNEGETRPVDIRFSVREAKSGRVVGRVTNRVAGMQRGTEETILVTIPIADCKLWSPETPFLYRLEADSGADRIETRFGMREFRFDQASGRAMLNGRPYYMRGSNITLYRFFEDPECGDSPWQEGWVRKLHQRVKEMNWNSLRYCIGFPPEFWYDIADEEGILIQDEFPIWFATPAKKRWPEELKSEQLALEYGEWMRERWNHPSVVIWDATNETVSEETGKAISQVRGLDLSGRPWDNSYMPPQEPGDVFESHPYHFINPHFKLWQLQDADPVPRGNYSPNKGNNAIVINE
jgi:beta-galactosidase